MRLKVDGDRLLGDLASLAQVGETAEGGVSRPAFSAADVAGRQWFRQRVEDSGLELREDGAGNLSARLACGDPDAPTLLAGSHLDTVPNGGRYDGSLGVLAALEALRVFQEREMRLPVHLEAISFTDEEGTLLGEFGSRALAGSLSAADLERARGGPAALEEGLTRLGLDCEGVLSSARPAKSLAGYVELHIEQGTRLEEAGVDVGVVTAIVGIRSGRLTFHGQAGHAGTLPLDRRKDALWGAAAFVPAARDLVQERFAPGVMNCGDLKVEPGAFNVVPAKAVVSLELRHGSEEELSRMQDEVLEMALALAGKMGLAVTWDPAESCPAAPSSERIVAAIEDSAEALGFSHQRLLSFAGHDAQALAPVTATGMIFIPCEKGVSHHPAEACRPQDVVRGADVLLNTLWRLASFDLAG